MELIYSKNLKKKVLFLGDLDTPKFLSEINLPLEKREIKVSVLSSQWSTANVLISMISIGCKMWKYVWEQLTFFSHVHRKQKKDVGGSNDFFFTF